LHAIGTRAFPWTEIDFPEDYERAVREILPAIEGDEVAVGGARRTSNTTVIEQPDATIVVRRVRMRPDLGSMPLSPASGE
jgi:hypothetical protein